MAAPNESYNKWFFGTRIEHYFVIHSSYSKVNPRENTTHALNWLSAHGPIIQLLVQYNYWYSLTFRRSDSHLAYRENVNFWTLIFYCVTSFNIKVCFS